MRVRANRKANETESEMECEKERESGENGVWVSVSCHCAVTKPTQIANHPPPSSLTVPIGWVAAREAPVRIQSQIQHPNGCSVGRDHSLRYLPWCGMRWMKW